MGQSQKDKPMKMIDEQITKELLEEKILEAKRGMFIESGAWTVGKCEECSVPVGEIELKDGTTAYVKIVVSTKED